MNTTISNAQVSPDSLSWGKKWWVYQRERFPILAHGLLIAAFSSSAVCFSSLLRGAVEFPSLGTLGVAFGCCLIFFLQLRIADEFKDYEEDARFRPYRPVPRGLVSLRELGWVFAGGALIQLALASWLSPRLLVVLVVTWIYLAAMSKEFFIREWLVRHPITYLWTHMLIMPLIDLTATACDWAPLASSPPAGLFWFLLVSFANGVVIEIGRKIRVPSDEEEGVSTYSKMWGLAPAAGVWLAMLGLTGALALTAAREIEFMFPLAMILGGLVSLASFAVAMVVVRGSDYWVKKIEAISGLWTLGLYTGLGIVPLLWKGVFS